MGAELLAFSRSLYLLQRENALTGGENITIQRAFTSGTEQRMRGWTQIGPQDTVPVGVLGGGRGGAVRGCGEEI